mgnify:CR=1 FL=1
MIAPQSYLGKEPPPAARGVIVDEVDGLAGLEALAGPWSRLVAAVDYPVAFVRPEWMLPFVRSFAGGANLRVFVAWAGAELVAVLPFSGTDALAYLGNDHTPEADFLSNPEHRRPVLEAFLDRVQRPHSGVASVGIPKMPEACENARALQVLLRDRHFFVQESSYWQARHTRVEGAFDAFAKARSKNFRKQVKRADKARRTHDLSVEVLTTAESVAAILPELARVSAASWQGKEHTGTFAGEDSFYREMLDRFAAAGALRLYVCKKGGRCVGYVLCLAGHGVLEALKSEFDSALGELMIGWQIYRAMYDDAAACGLTDINSGSYVTEFKDRWATHHVDLLGLRFFPPTLGGSLRFLPGFGKEVVKRVTRRSSVTRCYPLLDEIPEGRKRKTTPPPEDDG